MQQEWKQHSIPGNEWNGEKTELHSYNNINTINTDMSNVSIWRTETNVIM